MVSNLYVAAAFVLSIVPVGLDLALQTRVVVQPPPLSLECWDHRHRAPQLLLLLLLCFCLLCKKVELWANQVAQQVKCLQHKPDDLIQSHLWNPTWKDTDSQKLFSDFHMCAMTQEHMHTHNNKTLNETSKQNNTKGLNFFWVRNKPCMIRTHFSRLFKNI